MQSYCSFSPKILGVSLTLCQKVVDTAGGIFLPDGKKIWGGVILTIRKLFKAKNSIFVNTEHQLKSTLAWSVFQKSMKLKQNGTGAMTS